MTLQPEEFSDTLIKLGDHTLAAINIQIADWGYYLNKGGHYFELPYENDRLVIVHQATETSDISVACFWDWKSIQKAMDAEGEFTEFEREQLGREPDLIQFFENWEEFLDYHLWISQSHSCLVYQTEDAYNKMNGQWEYTLIPEQATYCHSRED